MITQSLLEDDGTEWNVHVWAQPRDAGTLVDQVLSLIDLLRDLPPALQPEHGEWGTADEINAIRPATFLFPVSREQAFGAALHAWTTTLAYDLELMPPHRARPVLERCMRLLGADTQWFVKGLPSGVSYGVTPYTFDLIVAGVGNGSAAGDAGHRRGLNLAACSSAGQAAGPRPELAV